MDYVLYVYYLAAKITEVSLIGYMQDNPDPINKNHNVYTVIYTTSLLVKIGSVYLSYLTFNLALYYMISKK
jgi:hypothetical protein